MIENIQSKLNTCVKSLSSINGDPQTLEKLENLSTIVGKISTSEKSLNERRDVLKNITVDLSKIQKELGSILINEFYDSSRNLIHDNITPDLIDNIMDFADKEKPSKKDKATAEKQGYSEAVLSHASEIKKIVDTGVPMIESILPRSPQSMSFIPNAQAKSNNSKKPEELKVVF